MQVIGCFIGFESLCSIDSSIQSISKPLFLKSSTALVYFGPPTIGEPKVITLATSSGNSRAHSRAIYPPRLQPIIMTGVPSSFDLCLTLAMAFWHRNATEPSPL